MLKITDKQACCGCQACFDSCPSKCITMVVDKEGFLYPEVRQADCIDCKLCEKVCPQLNPPAKDTDTPIVCYAAWAENDSIRVQSSSGGVFTLLAEAILARGGVVFGARYDDSFTVCHSHTDTLDGLPPFRGSKYVQSDLRGAFSSARKFLDEQRTVLFTGTPCQIAGLRAFLRKKDYEKLFLVSVICHGVPSPLAWKKYLEAVCADRQPAQVSMRNKDNGWAHFRIKIQQNEQDIVNDSAFENPYMMAFLNNLILRPSCFACPFRGNHGSDLTLGDYWGVEKIHPEMSDDKGTSLILVYSEKGRQLLDGLDIALKETHYEDALRGNMAIIQPAYKPAERTMFWKSFQKRGARALTDYTANSRRARARRLWAKLLRRLRIG